MEKRCCNILKRPVNFILVSSETEIQKVNQLKILGSKCLNRFIDVKPDASYSICQDCNFNQNDQERLKKIIHKDWITESFFYWLLFALANDQSYGTQNDS